MTPPDALRRQRRKNIFVLGLDDIHLHQLESLHRADEYRFHELCSKSLTRSTREEYSYEADDFASPAGQTEHLRRLERGDWSVRTITRSRLTSDATSFHLAAELDAYEGERRVFSRNWSRHVPRRLV